MITVVQTTSDSRAELNELSEQLVEQHLAACGQVEGPIVSTYVWEGETKNSEEFRLTIKTTQEHVASVEAHIKSHHSYDLPEIIWFDVAVSVEYESWVRSQTT